MTTHIARCGHAPQTPIKPESDVPRWRLGLVVDCAGHAHVGALVPASDGGPPIYMDLLAPVGAASIAYLDLDGFSVIVQGERTAALRRIILECIDDARLKQRLLELLSISVAALADHG